MCWAQKHFCKTYGNHKYKKLQSKSITGKITEKNSKRMQLKKPKMIKMSYKDLKAMQDKIKQLKSKSWMSATSKPTSSKTSSSLKTSTTKTTSSNIYFFEFIKRILKPLWQQLLSLQQLILQQLPLFQVRNRRLSLYPKVTTRKFFHHYSREPHNYRLSNPYQE